MTEENFKKGDMFQIRTVEAKRRKPKLTEVEVERFMQTQRSTVPMAFCPPDAPAGIYADIMGVEFVVQDEHVFVPDFPEHALAEKNGGLFEEEPPPEND